MGKQWAISTPRSQGANVVYRTRLVIDEVPEDKTAKDVLAWLDDETEFDYAHPYESWTATEQLSAEEASHVRWTGD